MTTFVQQTAEPSHSTTSEQLVASPSWRGRETPVHVKILLKRLADLPEDHPDRQRVRDRVVRLCLPLAEHLAARFRNRGEPDHDLRQVAAIGLIKAVDGFDPGRGIEFSGYAIPTITGELKRHFRDKGWALRVPRRLQELKLDIAKAVGELTQTLQRSPTVADIARHLGRREEDVLEGLDAARAYSAVSLAAPVSGDHSSDTTVADLLGEDDTAMQRVDDRAALRPLIASLPEREQRIIAMRFFDNLTQSQIAEKIGISQMHVSRLLAKSLSQLREGMLTEG